MARLTEKKLKKVYRPKDEDGAWIEIEYLKPGVRDHIDSVTSEVSASGDAGQLETTVNFNSLKKRQLFYEAAIHDWGNFFDTKGNAVKPTRRNIDFFDKELGDLYTWLSEEMEAFILEVEAEEEEELGN